MDREKHCNYANYPTFQVAVHLANDRDLHKRAIALQALYGSTSEESEQAFRDLYLSTAPTVRNIVRFERPGANMIEYFLGQVDWREVAEDFAPKSM